MGMDYTFAGSASYPRFDNEIVKIAELFGGVTTEHLNEIKKQNDENESFTKFFGFLYGDDNTKFVFPEGTNEILVKWFNNIYNCFSPKDTKTVFDIICTKREEVEEISHQLFYELESLCECGFGWDIN